MLELTNTAKTKLFDSLAATRMPDREGKCFRFVPKDDKYLGLKLAKPAPGDAIVKHDGLVILAVPKALRPFFKDKILDIDDKGELQLN